ncbi:MAG: hypothetical protein EBE86_004970 [Hormoscilla sp. GUM202]|nr:hypothetical protein [Hormoscilla sp. GUM202]
MRATTKNSGNFHRSGLRIGRKGVNSIGLAVSHFLALDLLWWCSIDAEILLLTVEVVWAVLLLLISKSIWHLRLRCRSKCQKGGRSGYNRNNLDIACS